MEVADHDRCARLVCGSVGSRSHDLVGEAGTSCPRTLALTVCWGWTLVREEARLSGIVRGQCRDQNGDENRARDGVLEDPEGGRGQPSYQVLGTVGDSGAHSVSAD